MGFSLRLGCWSPLSGYLAFYMSLFSVAARLPYLNRSAGKIGVNRIQTLAVTRSLSKTAGALQSLMTHAMTAVSLIYFFFYRTYVFLRMILQRNKKHTALIN